MSLLCIPAPAGGRKGEIVMPLGPCDLDPEEERRLRRAEACARYREKNREAVNRRVQAWRERKAAKKPVA